ncbi:hypothetical protein EB061_06890 [bacterium]|jgi:hypothetical protein|nr:hypothetical protein [bacterium]
MNNQIRLILIAPFLLLSACRYENEFTGTYNQQPAKMSAFSKNTEKYCIELNVKGNAGTRQAFIGARSVFDERDFSRPVSFNTKGESCGANLPEYLVGSRNTKIQTSRPFTRNEVVAGVFCQWVTYQEFLYNDDIQLEFRNRLSDQTVAVFQGTGRLESFVDFARPVSYGPMYPCSYGPGPFPRYFP